MAQYLLAIHRDYAVALAPSADLDEALEWAKLASAAQLRPIEVRPFFDGDLDDAILASVGAAEAEVIWRDAFEAQ